MKKIALILAFTFTACFDSDSDTKKVELVDNTTKNTDTGKQAVSDEDFAALQEKVKALESKLAALESVKEDVTALEGDVSSVQTTVSSVQSTVSGHGTSITSLNTSVNTLNTTVSGHGTRLTAAEADIAAHESELAAMNSTVNTLASKETPKQLWMYDGNKVKRHKVVALYDRTAWQEAIVEITGGVNARYRLNRFTPTTESPAELETPGGSTPSIAFTGSSCTGVALVSDTPTGGDFGQAGTIGSYFLYVTAGTTRYNDTYVRSSIYDGTSCIANAGTFWGPVSVAIVSSKSTYSYPNPITVGP
jgi:hypothetical protein